jgi:MoaA/NifB/PqqE/SkfB family radical SAM enzyme
MNTKQEFSVPTRVGGLFSTQLNAVRQKNSEKNLEECAAGNTTLSAYPRRILLELTNMCNYRCIMCGRNFSSFKPSYIKRNLINKLQSFFEKAEEVTLFGWGEPTIHPEFSEILRQLQTYDSLRKYILTNGSNIEYIKDLVERGWIDLLAISLDGSTPASNDSIRCGSSFESITSGIRKIVKLQDKGLKIPYINLVFVMMRQNIHELAPMVQLAHDLGIPEVKFTCLTSFHESLDKETLWERRDEYERHLETARELSEKLKINIKYPPAPGKDPTGTLPHKPCFVAWRDLFVGSDGTIRPCQSSSQVLGDLSLVDLDKASDPFNTIFNSTAFNELRACVNNEDMPVQCRNCYQASHANWNLRHAHIQTGVFSSPEWGSQPEE